MLVIVEHVAGAGVVIAGLADAADIDGIALPGIEADRFFRGLQATAGESFWIHFPDSGNMGVAVEADECCLCSKMSGGFRFIVDVVELRGFMERGVRERDRIQIGGDGGGTEPGFLGFRELLVGEVDGLPDRDVPVLVGDFVGNQQHGIMVAEDCHRAGIHDSLDAGGGLGAVSHNIAQAEHAFDGKLFDVGKNSVQGIDVGVDIAEDRKEGIGF